MTAHTSYLTQSQSDVKLGKKKHEIHPDYKCQVTINLINFHLFHSNDACGAAVWRVSMTPRVASGAIAGGQHASGQRGVGSRPEAAKGLPRRVRPDRCQKNRLSGLDDGGMWQSMLECGRKNGSADSHIGCNWQKSSGRRARALAASGVWHGRENENHDLLRCMWSLHRVSVVCFGPHERPDPVGIWFELLFFWIMFGWISSDILECWSACFWAPWVPTPLEITMCLWPRLMEHQGLHRVVEQEKHHELSTWLSVSVVESFTPSPT